MEARLCPLGLLLPDSFWVLVYVYLSPPGTLLVNEPVKRVLVIPESPRLLL